MSLFFLHTLLKQSTCRVNSIRSTNTYLINQSGEPTSHAGKFTGKFTSDAELTADHFVVLQQFLLSRAAHLEKLVRWGSGGALSD